MRKIFTILVCLVACLNANSKVLNKLTARQKASQFIADKGIKMSIKDTPYEYRAADMSEAQLYVCRAENDKGFVVVSADDNTELILGYSEDSAFDPNDIPANLQWWLEGTSRQIAYAKANGLTNQSQVYVNPAIEPMCTTTWNQDYPYNYYAPTINGEQCPIGCAATALAQIMYYHKWPMTECASIGAYTTTTYRISRPALASTTFDWDSMQDNYTSSSTNIEPVAKLMRYVAQALKMDFAPEGSGAWPTPSTLRDYFGYYSSVRQVKRAGYTVSQWDEIIYNELKNNRPVMYCGFTPNNDGHGFVCDGYDGNGFYHINWGWGGKTDGFFRLSVLNPNSTSGSGAASTDDGFTNDQSVLIGIQKEGPDNTVQPWPLKSISYTASTNKVKYSVTSPESNYYEFNLANISDGQTITPLFDTASRFCTKGNTYAQEFALTGLSNGTYNLYGVIRKMGETTWQRLGGVSQYAEVTVSGGNINVVMHPIVDYSLTNVYFPNNILMGKPSRLNINVKNNADEFTENLYVFTGTDDKLTTPCGNIYLSMLTGEEFVVSASVVTNSINNFTVGVTSDSEGKNVLYKHTYYNYDIEVESSSVSWNPCVVTIRLKNNTATDYDNTIFATFYQEGVKKALGTLKQDVHIPANGVGEAVFELAFTTDKKYYATLQHMQSELTSTKVNIAGQVPIVYDPSGIEEVTNDAEDNAVLYNVSGQKVGRDYKGVVISNGKKYIRK